MHEARRKEGPIQNGCNKSSILRYTFLIVMLRRDVRLLKNARKTSHMSFYYFLIIDNIPYGSRGTQA